MSESRWIGPEFLNEALREAKISDITMTKTWRGRLRLKTGLSGQETIDVLISGLAMLYTELRIAREESLDDRSPSSLIGPPFLNEALREAKILNITMTKTPQGQLYLDTKLTGKDTINALISGLAMLYGQLLILRAQESGDYSKLHELREQIEQ